MQRDERNPPRAGTSPPPPAHTGGGVAADAARRRPAPLHGRLAGHLRETGLLAPGATVLVAVSGGLDSVALLHLLRFRLPRWNLRLVAAHFDHGMREGSGADAAWVAGLCRAWRIPVERGRADSVPRGEAEAREARYRFLHAAADRRGADRIATAHHADDQAETVLFRIARGTGLRGLAGIPARRGRIVRPLLPFRRAEILGYARAAGLRFREDPTNRSLDFARNRIRHEVLPRLESIAPGAATALVRLAAHARAAESALDAVLDTLEPEAVLRREERAVVLARPVLLSYHAHIRVRLLRRVFRRLGSRPGRAGTSTAVEFITTGPSGGEVRVAGGIRLAREFDRIRVERVAREAAPAPDRPLRIDAGRGAGAAVIGGRRFAVRWTDRGEDELPGAVSFPLEALRFPLEIRGWRPGDRIRLPYGSKKLKKLFAERRVGRADRARTPVLADAGGSVLWVVGVAEAAAAGSAGPHLRITVTDAEYA